MVFIRSTFLASRLTNYEQLLSLLLYCPCLCCHSFCDIYVVFLSASESVQVVFCFIVCYMCIAVGDPIMKKTGLGYHQPVSGADPGFQVRGAHLKKMRRAEGGAKIVGVFRVKNHDFTPKNHIFSNFRGAGGAGCPALDPPLT